MNGLSEQQLAEIAARAEAATPGPWKANGAYASNLRDGSGAAVGELYCDGADQEFILHARTDVPALLAEVARLRGALSEATGYVAELEADLGGWSARVAELEAEAAKVAEFVAARAEYITAINSCHPDNAHDYHRWQGHAESRRQLAGALGLPVAWPAKSGSQS